MPILNSHHSPEVADIMGTIPSWIVRWGVTVVFAIFAGVFAGCWFIKYPDTIVAPAVITTLNPPSDLVARHEGLIDTLCVADGEAVSAGHIVAVLRTAASWKDVAQLSVHLDASVTLWAEELAVAPWLDEHYELGELQSAFAEFQSRCRDYRHYLTTDHISRRRQLIIEQIAKSREYYTLLEGQRTLLLKDLDYGRRILVRDSLLFSNAVISEADYEAVVQNYIAKQNTQAGFDASLTLTELQIIQSEQQLVELSLQHSNETAEYESALWQSRQQLTAQLAQWRQQYVLEAPSAGIVTLTGYWSSNQRIFAGDKLASIVPDGVTEIIGRLQIPSAGFGKIRTGQRVQVRLNGYPYMEFGVLRGEIRSLSAVPEQVQTSTGHAIVYLAEVLFPEGMTTSYGRELPMIQQMDGTAEIITEDMRLIERFVQPLISLFKNR